MKTHHVAIAGILIVFALGMIALNGVQAQTTPGTSTTSKSFERLSNNIPILEKIMNAGTPIVNPDADIRELLQFVGTEEKFHFFVPNQRNAALVLSNYTEPNALHALIADGDPGEIQVYEYVTAKDEFVLMDCAYDFPFGGFDDETGNIWDVDGGILSAYPEGTKVTLNDFLNHYGCEIGFAASSTGYDSLTLSNTFIGAGNSISSVVQKSSSTVKSIIPANNFFTKTAENASATENTTPEMTALAGNGSLAFATSCEPGTVVKEYALTDNTANIGANHTPKMVTANDFDLESNDARLPASIIFYENVNGNKFQKYLLNISGYEIIGTNIRATVSLCYNDNGWKNFWDTKYVYSTNKEHTKYTQILGAQPTGKPIDAPIIFWESNPEISIKFTGAKGSVFVYLYVHNTDLSLNALAFDASKELVNKNYRFTFDNDSFANLRGLDVFKGQTPDAIKPQLAVQIKGLKNNTGKLFDTTAGIELITAEGVLFQNTNSNDKYWIVRGSTTPIQTGEYLLTITIDGYRSIEKKIFLSPKEFSPESGNNLSFGDVHTFSISNTELKKDVCSICTTLQACLQCVDTIFVDKITAKK